MYRYVTLNNQVMWLHKLTNAAHNLKISSIILAWPCYDNTPQEIAHLTIKHRCKAEINVLAAWHFFLSGAPDQQYERYPAHHVLKS